jgi:hypothetical protein
MRRIIVHRSLARNQQSPAGASRGDALLPRTEGVGKRFGGVDIANGDDELAPAIALRRHAEG